MHLKSRLKPNQERVGSLRERLNAIGVQTFNFAFYPEGPAMLEYNTQENSKAHATRFTSSKAWQNGSSKDILEEFLGRVHPDDHDKLTEYVQAHIESSMNEQVGTEPTSFSSERFRAMEPGQKYRWYELRSHLILEKTLKIIICEGCFLDITDLVEREQELAQEVAERRCAQQHLEDTLRTLKETQGELIASSKLKALGEMTSSVAHDFGNLLNPLLFYGESLQIQFQKLGELTNRSLDQSSVGEFKKELARLVETSQANLDKMDLAILDGLSMLQRLRETYLPTQALKSDQGRPCTPLKVAASELVQSAWFLARSRWRGEVGQLPKFEVSGEDFELPPINESELRQVLINLMCNALDAVYEKLQDHLVISVILAVEVKTFSISIIDQGIGMNPQTLQLAQRSFYSSKGKNGSGLGLSSVQYTMNKLGGNVIIASKLNEWTKVTLTLPKNSTES